MKDGNVKNQNDKLVMNLRDISHTMKFLYEGRGSQKRILIILREVGSITQRELTERLGIKPGSASEVIAKLEHAGLIRRISSEEDRRTTIISLTEEGEKRAVEAQEQRKQRHEQMFFALSDNEKTQLLSLLEKVNADWEVRYQDIEENQMHKGPHHGKHHEGHEGHGHHGEHGCHEGDGRHGKHEEHINSKRSE